MSRLKKVALFGISIFLVTFFCVTRVEHFSKELLQEKVEGTATDVNFPLLDEIVSTPLHYIGCGKEAIAFASADDKYVIKFFLKERIITKVYFKPRTRLHQLFGKAHKIKTVERTLKRYEQGLHYLPEETVLLAVSRYKAQKTLPICTLIDHRGALHSVDLNELAFVVQRKAKVIKGHFTVSELEKLTSKFHNLFVALSSKGFVNLSPMFNSNNFAILEDKAVMIDLGKLEFLPELSYEHEETKLKSRYSDWLKKKL